jgi:hypothetical protein
MLALMALTGSAVATVAVGLALQRARRTGSLAQY